MIVLIKGHWIFIWTILFTSLVDNSLAHRFPNVLSANEGQRSWSVVGRQEQVLDGPASEAGDLFGRSVATDGDVVVIGAPAASADGSNTPSGVAFIFSKKDGVWESESKLSIKGSTNRDYFGWTTAICDGMIAIGAYLAFGDIKGVGLVYIYRRDLNNSLRPWREEKILGVSGPMQPGTEQRPGWGSQAIPDFYYFGYSLAMENGTIVAGAYGYDSKGTFSGAVFVYNYEISSVIVNGTRSEETAVSWLKNQLLLPGDLQSFSHFGWSVAISGDIIVVGAYGDPANNRPYAGSAYVFQKISTSWSQVAKLRAGDPRSHDHFGYTVAAQSEIVAISSQRSSPDSMVADGIVHLYKLIRMSQAHNRWIKIKELQVFTATPDLYFGYSLSMRDNLLLVGLSGVEPSYGTAIGPSAHLYSLVSLDDGSMEVMRDVTLMAFGRDNSKYFESPHFACSLSLFGNLIVIGDSAASGSSQESGTAFLFIAGKDYFPIGANTYEFLVYFLPSAFSLIFVVSLAFVAIGWCITRCQQQQQGDDDVSDSCSDTDSVSSSRKGLVNHDTA